MLREPAGSSSRALSCRARARAKAGGCGARSRLGAGLRRACVLREGARDDGDVKWRKKFSARARARLLRKARGESALSLPGARACAGETVV